MVHTATTLASLSPARQLLVRLMQEIGFGFVERLTVRQGEPVMEPKPHVVLQAKFGSGYGCFRPESGISDFVLKAEVRQLLARIEEMGDGTVLSLEVRHGLPFVMTFEEGVA